MKEAFKERLIRHIGFLEEELQDLSLFESLNWETYRTDRIERRNVERWIENLVNSSIDISKLVIASEGIRIPETYRQIVSSLSLVREFDREEIEKLSRWVILRNILAHEYLDTRWASIERFIQQAGPLYKDFLERVKKYVKRLLVDE
jgi:uncharacterized protein YutE (UPF0331/DUF86 family)